MLWFVFGHKQYLCGRPPPFFFLNDTQVPWSLCQGHIQWLLILRSMGKRSNRPLSQQVSRHMSVFICLFMLDASQPSVKDTADIMS